MKSQEGKFMAALENGDMEYVLDCLQNAKERESLFRIVLVQAVTAGDAKCLKLLQDAGFNPTRTYSDGKNALDIARQAGVSEEIIKLLTAFSLEDEKVRTVPAFVHANSTAVLDKYLQKGMDVNIYFKGYTVTEGRQIPMSYTALLHACRMNRMPNVQFLLERGADVNLPVLLGEEKRCGPSALMLAAEHKNFKLMQELINAGADLSYQDAGGESIQTAAACFGVDSWLKQYQTQKYRECFHQAALRGDVAYVQAHLGEVNRDHKNKAFTDTPSVAVAEILLSEGVDVNAVFASSFRQSVHMHTKSYSALAFACKNNYTEKALWLLNHHADPNICWNETNLVAGPANIDEAYTLSPLMLSVQNNNFVLVKRLLQAGADIHLKGRNGYTETTALDIAKHTAGAEMIDFLQKAGVVEGKEA